MWVEEIQETFLLSGESGGLDKIIQKMGFKDSGPQTTVEVSSQNNRCYPMKKSYCNHPLRSRES